jgi:hypothetical protein
LLALDEFSAVARRVPVHELAERCRSLGLAVQVAAQCSQGLAPHEDDRARLAAAAAGGVLVMRCPDPEPLCRLAGTRAVIETGRKIIGPGRYGDEGTGRLQRAWVADPDRIRNFRPGQAAYLHGAACTYVHVAAYRGSRSLCHSHPPLPGRRQTTRPPQPAVTRHKPPALDAVRSAVRRGELLAAVTIDREGQPRQPPQARREQWSAEAARISAAYRVLRTRVRRRLVLTDLAIRSNWLRTCAHPDVRAMADAQITSLVGTDLTLEEACDRRALEYEAAALRLERARDGNLGHG